jgi:hypothetical protein
MFKGRYVGTLTNWETPGKLVQRWKSVLEFYKHG